MAWSLCLLGYFVELLYVEWVTSYRSVKSQTRRLRIQQHKFNISPRGRIDMETWRKKGSNKEFAKPEKQLITIDSKEMRRSHSKMENFFIVLQRPELNLETEVIESHFMNVKWNRPCRSRR